MKVVYSKEACELMAQQLVAEQAEIVKKQAAIEGLKMAMLEKKKQIIKDCFNNFCFEFDKPMFALELDFSGFELDFMTVRMYFGADPYTAMPESTKLTKREKELLEKYSKALCCLPNPNNQEYGRAARMALEELRQLKNHLDLLVYRSWHIFMDDLTRPDFFSNTGLRLWGVKGMYKPAYLLEDLACKG